MTPGDATVGILRNDLFDKLNKFRTISSSSKSLLKSMSSYLYRPHPLMFRLNHGSTATQSVILPVWLLPRTDSRDRLACSVLPRGQAKLVEARGLGEGRLGD